MYMVAYFKNSPILLHSSNVSKSLIEGLLIARYRLRENCLDFSIALRKDSEQLYVFEVSDN